MKFPEHREIRPGLGRREPAGAYGYRISELPHRAAHGEVRAAYIMGEDPLQTDAELSAVRKAFEELELVIVRGIFS
ncbi:hypothetical protein DMH17_12765 [Raoultella planticola]|nr:hypothetical protein [Raoultella planticola]